MFHNFLQLKKIKVCVGKAVQKRETSYTVSGNGEATMESNGGFSQKNKNGNTI